MEEKIEVDGAGQAVIVEVKPPTGCIVWDADTEEVTC